MVGDVSAAAAWALGIACAGGCASTEQSNRPPGPAPTRGRLNLPAVTSDSRLTAVRSLNFEPMLHTFPGHLPPLKTVQVALRKTTETLAHWLARPTPDVPDWSDFEWRVARAAAALHGVSPILSSQSRGSVPVGWQMFLDEQRAHTSKRYLRIKELLQLVDDGARVAGIPFVALKGAALYELALYAAGERPMADLDLLVRAQHVERMAETLQSVGFAQSASTLKHRVFESAEGGQAARFGEDFRNGIKIDLHVGIREYLPRHAVDVSGLMMPLQPRPGINPYRSPSALMLHLLLHAAGAIVLRTLRLVQLHDMALLSRRMSDVDWEELLRQAASARCGLWWAYAPLRLLRSATLRSCAGPTSGTFARCPSLISAVRPFRGSSGHAPDGTRSPMLRNESNWRFECWRERWQQAQSSVEWMESRAGAGTPCLPAGGSRSDRHVLRRCSRCGTRWRSRIESRD